MKRGNVNKLGKILLVLGTSTIAIARVVLAVSCSSSKSNANGNVVKKGPNSGQNTKDSAGQANPPVVSGTDSSQDMGSSTTVQGQVVSTTSGGTTVQGPSASDVTSEQLFCDEILVSDFKGLSTSYLYSSSEYSFTKIFIKFFKWALSGCWEYSKRIYN